MGTNSQIHPSSVISPKAQIGDNVTIGPFCYIGDDVVIGDECEIKSHAYIEGPTKIGKRNKIWPFVTLGAEAQHLKNQSTDDQLIIGDDNLIREGAMIHRGTSIGGKITRIGNKNLIMGSVHIAHDCQVGNNNILSQNSTMAGHASIGDNVIMSWLAAVHQFCSIGNYCFIGKCTSVVQDIPPYTLCAENGTKKIMKFNAKGVQRSPLDEKAQEAAKDIYSIFYRKGLTTQDALEHADTNKLAESFPEAKDFVDFIKASERGITKPKL